MSEGAGGGPRPPEPPGPELVAFPTIILYGSVPFWDAVAGTFDLVLLCSQARVSHVIGWPAFRRSILHASVVMLLLIPYNDQHSEHAVRACCKVLRW